MKHRITKKDGKYAIKIEIFEVDIEDKGTEWEREREFPLINVFIKNKITGKNPIRQAIEELVIGYFKICDTGCCLDGENVEISNLGYSWSINEEDLTKLSIQLLEKVEKR